MNKIHHRGGLTIGHQVPCKICWPKSVTRRCPLCEELTSYRGPFWMWVHDFIVFAGHCAIYVMLLGSFFGVLSATYWLVTR
jgi:cytosine/uracil/thiamine/allantoin permease